MQSLYEEDARLVAAGIDGSTKTRHCTERLARKAVRHRLSPQLVSLSRLGRCRVPGVSADLPGSLSGNAVGRGFRRALGRLRDEVRNLLRSCTVVTWHVSKAPLRQLSSQHSLPGGRQGDIHGTQRAGLSAEMHSVKTADGNGRLTWKDFDHT